jgi:hypothetical protein
MPANGSQSSDPNKSASGTQQGPRQLAPGVLGYRYRSRHMAMMSGPRKLSYYFYFLKNPLFWGICISVSVILLGGLWAARNVPVLPRTDLTAIRIYEEWKRRVLTVNEKPAVKENGKVVQPAEKQYTVTTEILDRPQPTPAPADKH